MRWWPWRHPLPLKLDFGTASLEEWLPRLGRVLEGTGANATVVLAVLRGLLLDILAAEDDTHAERVHTAWRAFLDATLG
ncbi:hypothetical protein [Kitasatospora sp. NPDC017646]|uniref:hypothetical protein n=1 Tax=Kitasatospora sp. NPDC017646 TaxID=3364024 RepID=UPI0037874BD1